MGNTVRHISSHSLFDSGKQGDRSDAAAGNANKDVDRVTTQSIKSKRPGLAMQLDKADKAMEDAPVVDRGKIDSIKARIDNGTYHINTRSIVDKLLQTEDLLK